MTSNPDKPDTINTGGGAYVGGSVSPQGSDFIGRDKVVTAGERGVAVGGNATGSIVTGDSNVISQRQGATLEELRSLLAELKHLLPQVGLQPEVAEVIEGDFKVVEQQASQASPNGGILKNRLKSMLELLTSSGNAASALEKILVVAGKAAQVAGLLFP